VTRGLTIQLIYAACLMVAASNHVLVVVRHRL
jgi:hypothetical protein